MAMKVGNAAGRYTIRQNSDINVTPFVDIMLVLLIIFMVSIPTATVSIKLDMPPPAAPTQPEKPPVFISIMGPDDIYIGAQKSSPATLIHDVTTALESKDPFNERILVRGDKDIQYADFIKVLNELQQGGFLKVGLVNEDIS